MLEHDDCFWVKASGFVRVRFAEIQKALSAGEADDERVREVLRASRADDTPLMPSVETFMHAYLLGLPDVSFVGHTHPTALLSLLCLDDAEGLAQQRLFPDEVVCCGPAAAYVPYVDPGFPLARAIKEAVERFVDQHGIVPKTIWMQNHGLIALGKSAREIESATLMSIKAARVWLGALSTGRTIRTMSPDQVARIHSRPDEHYRQRLLWQMRN
jgi:L-ribulose-5-phosphate 4-epimerase